MSLGRSLQHAYILQAFFQPQKRFPNEQTGRTRQKVCTLHSSTVRQGEYAYILHVYMDV